MYITMNVKCKFTRRTGDQMFDPSDLVIVSTAVFFYISCGDVGGTDKLLQFKLCLQLCVSKVTREKLV